MKNLNDLNPFQLFAFAGSAAVNYDQLQEQGSTDISPSQRIFSIPPDDLPQPLISDPDKFDYEGTYLTKREEEKQLGDNIVHFKPTNPIKTKFQSFQKWECYVVQDLGDSFIARLIDLTNGEEDEEAEFSIQEVHKEDRPFIKPGAIFYWNIGYLEERGQRIRASMIRFRRIPEWRTDEIHIAEQNADRLQNLLNQNILK